MNKKVYFWNFYQTATINYCTKFQELFEIMEEIAKSKVQELFEIKEEISPNEKKEKWE